MGCVFVALYISALVWGKSYCYLPRTTRGSENHNTKIVGVQKKNVHTKLWDEKVQSLDEPLVKKSFFSQTAFCSPQRVTHNSSNRSSSFLKLFARLVFFSFDEA